jgi:hypothetical protein
VKIDNAFGNATSSGTVLPSIGSTGSDVSGPSLAENSSYSMGVVAADGFSGRNDTIDFFTSGTSRFNIDSDGNAYLGSGGLGIGVANSTAGTLSTSGVATFGGAVTVTTGGLTVTAGGLTVSAGGASITGNLTVIGTGTTCVIGSGTGATMCTSDERLKTNIVKIESALDKLALVNGVTFNMRDQNKDQRQFIGLIAQDVQKAFPQSIGTTTVMIDGVESEYLTVDYASLVSPLIEGVNILNNRTKGISTSASTTLPSIFIDDMGDVSVGHASSTHAATVWGNFRVATNNVSSLFVNQATGVVGIGNDALAVADEMLRVSGRVRADGYDVDNNAGIAEKYEAIEAVDAGTVVAFGTTTAVWGQTFGTTTENYEIAGVRKAVNDKEAVGIVSTTSGITLAASTTNGVPVAFVGRVPVKVTTENGEVKAGDYLTVSTSTPGYAMKLTGEGRAIGRAVSSYVQGQDKVVMVIDNRDLMLDLAGGTATTTKMLTTGNLDLNANGVAIINIKSLASANGTWSIDEEGRIVAKVLCLEDVCIDKTQLTNILNSTGQTGIVAGTSTSPTTETSTTTASGGLTATSTEVSISPTETVVDTTTASSTDTTVSVPVETTTSTGTTTAIVPTDTSTPVTDTTTVDIAPADTTTTDTTTATTDSAPVVDTTTTTVDPAPVTDTTTVSTAEPTPTDTTTP